MGEFPHAQYKKVVLEPAYNEAKKHLLPSMIQIHCAHAKMLAKQQLIDEETTQKIKRALCAVASASFEEHVYTGRFEDLFFEVEALMLQEQGDAVGNVHIGRSRNDMGITMYRMVLRKKIVMVEQQLLALKKTLLEQARQHINTLMIGYTHTQQAQPTTFAHYLKAYVDTIDRDIERLESLYTRINRSPMGAAALTTTGFAIDRYQVASDLAFDGLIENAWDAVAGADYIAETATVIQIIALNIGRFAQDLLLWATREFGAIRLSDGFVQVSSIMPQKRNPVGIEHTRALASSIVGDTQTVIQMIHNTPFGDIVDTEDDLQPYLWRSLDKMGDVVALVSAYVSSLTVGKEVLGERTNKSMATITELADELVRSEGISFRQSHTIVAAFIQKENKDDVRSLSYHTLRALFQEMMKRALQLSEEDFKQTLNPLHFIETRQIVGSPAPSVMQDALSVSNEHLHHQEHENQRKFEAISKKETDMLQYIQLKKS